MENIPLYGVGGYINKQIQGEQFHYLKEGNEM